MEGFRSFEGILGNLTMELYSDDGLFGRVASQHFVEKTSVQWLSLRYPRNMHAGKVSKCAKGRSTLKDMNTTGSTRGSSLPTFLTKLGEKSVVGIITA